MKRQRALILLAILLLSLAVATAALAQSGGGRIGWQVLGSGGGQASAGAVTVYDTIGQPIAGASASGDGQVKLGAGYWYGLSVMDGTRWHLYLPSLRR